MVLLFLIPWCYHYLMDFFHVCLFRYLCGFIEKVQPFTRKAEGPFVLKVELPLPALCHKTNCPGAVKQSGRIPAKSDLVSMALFLCGKKKRISLYSMWKWLVDDNSLQVVHLTAFDNHRQCRRESIGYKDGNWIESNWEKDLNPLSDLFCLIYLLYLLRYKRNVSLLSSSLLLSRLIFLVLAHEWLSCVTGILSRRKDPDICILVACKYLIIQELKLVSRTGYGWHYTPNKIKFGMFSKTRQYRTANKCQYTRCDWWSVCLIASMPDGEAYESWWENMHWEN